MKVFHGTTHDFQFKKNKKSRYGFPAIFATTNRRLADNYAFAHYLQSGIEGKVISFDIPDTTDIIDLQGTTTHSYQFRNKIIELHRQGKKIVKIINAIDYPNKDFRTNDLSDIIVILDLSTITL